MGTDELLDAHRTLWCRAFSPTRVAARVARGARQLRTGAALMSATMNGFYGLKQMRNNLPRDMRDFLESPAREYGPLGSERHSVGVAVGAGR